MDINQLQKYVYDELELLNSGETFFVKDLFKGYEWSRLHINTRRDLGRRIISDVNTGVISAITAVGKNASNQMQYKKN